MLKKHLKAIVATQVGHVQLGDISGHLIAESQASADWGFSWMFYVICTNFSPASVLATPLRTQHCKKPEITWFCAYAICLSMVSALGCAELHVGCGLERLIIRTNRIVQIDQPALGKSPFGSTCS